MQTGDDVLLLVIENAVRPSLGLAAVGDLFMTAGGIHYVPYSSYQYSGKLGGTLGAAVGGLAGGLAAAAGEQMFSGDAEQRAAKARVRQYGLSLHERLGGEPFTQPIDAVTSRPLSVRRDQLQVLEVSKDARIVTCRTQEGKAAEFVVPKLTPRTVELIRAYARGEVVEPIADPAEYGFNLPYPSPTQLIEQFRTRGLPSQGMPVEIAHNRIYLSRLYLLLKELKRRDLEKVCQAIAEAKGEIPPALVKLATDDIRAAPKSLEGCISYFVILLFGFALVACCVQELRKPTINYANLLGTGSLFLGMIVFGVFLLRSLTGKAKIILQQLSQ